MQLLKIKNQIDIEIKNILSNKYNIDKKTIVFENPKEIQNGNLSTNIALQLTRDLKQNPIIIAEAIASEIQISEYISEVKVAKPGFINIYFSDSYFKMLIEEVDINYGSFKRKDQKKYLIEYISANPTGDLHLGHLRNAVYGNALVNLMKKAGYNVGTEYYLNDAGAQMNNLGLSARYFYLLLCNQEVDFPEDGYRGKDIESIGKMIFDEFNNQKKDESIDFFIEYSYKINLENIKSILEDINIRIDSWVSEKELFKNDIVKDTLQILEDSNDLYEKDGALWLRTSKYLDEKDRVLKKSTGEYTYFTADVAYHIEKYKKGFTNLINIWGADHHGYIPRIKSSIFSMGQDPDTLEIPIIQMVNLLEDSKTLKMSKRAGTSVTIKRLLSEIDKDVIKYFFVMRSPDTKLDFDISLAKEQSVNNPIYYINYAYVRINSILNKALEFEYKSKLNNQYFTEIEKNIINLISTYPELIVESANKRLPHIIANFLYNLASLFHKYYDQEKVFTDNPIIVEKKLYLLEKISIIFQDGLNILGIKLKNKM